jgi:hypothetical protein
MLRAAANSGEHSASWASKAFASARTGAVVAARMQDYCPQGNTGGFGRTGGSIEKPINRVAAWRMIQR